MSRKRVWIASLSGALLASLIAVLVGGRETATPTFEAQRPTLDLSQPGIVYGDSALLTTEGLEIAKLAQAIDPDIRGWYVFNSGTGQYTYYYRVWNKPAATNVIWHFGLAPLSSPTSVGVPGSAWEYSYGYDERRDALVWMVTERGQAPANWDSVSLWPSSFDIQPGDSVTGFSLTTPASPSMISYYVQGFNFPPPTDDEAGFTETYTLFQNSITGTIVGPGSAVGVDDSDRRGLLSQLALPVPNPSRTGHVSVTFYLPGPADVRLALYSTSGRLVDTLKEGPTPAGFHSVVWNGLRADGQRAASGLYFYKLTVNGRPAGQRQVVVLR